MQTDTICAFQLENNDYFSMKEEQFQVIELTDDSDYMEFRVREVATDDECEMIFAPFDVITLITSFEDDIEIPDFIE